MNLKELLLLVLMEKTTTTSMFSSTLETDPTIVVGGILPEINSNSKVGLGKYFIAEAIESDNFFCI